MSRDINPFGLRMSADLRDRIEKAATAAGRSMNTEIVHRLEQSLEGQNKDSHAADALATIIERLGEIEKQMGLRDGAITEPRRRTKRDEARAIGVKRK